MKPPAVVVLLLGSLLAGVAARDFDYCYSFDQDPYLLMGTKTAYQFVNGRQRLKPVPNCTPVQMWILSRHGSRYPGNKAVMDLSTLPKLRDQIVYFHENQGKGRMCNQDLDYLKNWRLNPNLTDYMANELTAQGELDLYLLARRLQTEFPELLRLGPQYINAENYKFRATESQRTRSSLEAFMGGLFNNKNAVPSEVPPANDMLLHPDKFCPAWERSNERDDVYRESDRFINSPEYQNLLHNVSRRLGFGYNLNNASVQLMYDMCRYEKAWDVNRLSVWCSVFSKEEMKVLEYLEDLDNYYHSGPGREINSKLGCNLMKDMFGHFKNLERGNFGNEPKGVFYFTHSTPLLNLLSALEIGKDAIPLTANNYNTMEKRSFKSSYLSAFTANLIAIFYRCSDPRSPNKVMFYLDEKTVNLDGCSVGLCDWEYLKDRYGHYADGCNLDFCYSTDSAASLSSFAAIFVSSLIVVRSLLAL